MIEINKEEFQAVVNLLEAKNTFNTRYGLWKAVEDTDWAKSQFPNPLRAATAAKKADKLGITVKTPAREPIKEEALPCIIDESPILTVPEPQKPTIIKNIRKKPVKYCKNKTVVPKTDLRLAVRDKCLDCSGGSKENVAGCRVKSCPLYEVRPFKLATPAGKESDNG